METKRTVTWEFHSEIVATDHDEAAGGVCARISILKLRYPKYSFELGWRRASTFSRNFRGNYDLKGSLEVIKKAQEFLSECDAFNQAKIRLDDEDRRLMEAREAAELDAKKAKAAEKKRRHEANLAVRRVQDQQRTAASKAGKHSNS